MVGKDNNKGLQKNKNIENRFKTQHPGLLDSVFFFIDQISCGNSTDRGVLENQKLRDIGEIIEET
jgi:hypothetical protein